MKTPTHNGKDVLMFERLDLSITWLPGQVKSVSPHYKNNWAFVTLCPANKILYIPFAQITDQSWGIPANLKYIWQSTSKWNGTGQNNSKENLEEIMSPYYISSWVKRVKAWGMLVGFRNRYLILNIMHKV